MVMRLRIYSLWIICLVNIYEVSQCEFREKKRMIGKVIIRQRHPFRDIKKHWQSQGVILTMKNRFLIKSINNKKHDLKIYQYIMKTRLLILTTREEENAICIIAV